MSSIQPVAAEIEAYLRNYPVAEDGAYGIAPDWLQQLRHVGAEQFRARGLPTVRVEAWKYTNLNPLRGQGFALAANADAPIDRGFLPSLVIGKRPPYRLVFVNGAYRSDLSTLSELPAGARLMSLAEAVKRTPDLLRGKLGRIARGDASGTVALNTAFLQDGYVLHLAPGITIDDPIEIVFVGAGGTGAPPVYYPRSLVIAEAGSRVTLVEYHVGYDGAVGQGGVYFSNAVTEVEAAEGAIVRHCKVQDESLSAFHLATTHAHLGRDARYDNFSFALGGRLSRNELHVILAAQGADCRLNGAYLMHKEQHVDTTLVVDHAAPNTTSRQLYKGVLDDKARGVFQGKIIVRPAAQKSDGQQLSRALLLSNQSEINTKPELEILADDVKCSHGATAGELDESALFYLRARGIPEDQARRLLIEAFLNEVIDGMALSALRMPLEQSVARWMDER